MRTNFASPLALRDIEVPQYIGSERFRQQCIATSQLGRTVTRYPMTASLTLRIIDRWNILKIVESVPNEVHLENWGA